MSAAKIIAIAVGALLLFGIFVVGAGYYWWKTQGPRLKAGAEAAKVEAAEFGDSTDNQGCLEESLERYDRCEDRFNCSVINNIFLLECLKASSAIAGFCEGVPKNDALAESISWRLDQCERHRRIGTHCGNLFGQVQEYCDSLLPGSGA